MKALLGAFNQESPIVGASYDTENFQLREGSFPGLVLGTPYFEGSLPNWVYLMLQILKTVFFQSSLGI